MNSNRSRSRLAGYTLVELLIAIAISTVVAGTLAAMMAHILAANSTMEEHLEGLTTLGRLGEQFRRDVHAASTAETEQQAGQPARLVLHLPNNGAIAYQIDNAGLTRNFSRAGQTPAREQFALPGMKVLGWNADSAKSGQLTLELGRLIPSGDDEPTVGSKFTIAAALGRDEKLAGERGP